jgi:hypothetical protein
MQAELRARSLELRGASTYRRPSVLDAVDEGPPPHDESLPERQGLAGVAASHRRRTTCSRRPGYLGFLDVSYDIAMQYGTSGGRHAALVFTRRADKLRPISCRAMRKGEKEAYDAAP